jgi:Uma2 family endonuclease
MAGEPRRKLDYDDILATPNDGKRYELVDGDLLVNPAPNPLHQRISHQLLKQLDAYFEQRKLGEVFYSPIDVILTPHDVFEPDLVVVAEVGHITQRGIERPPLLAVEIFSPSTRRVDRGLKFRRYAELGIPHYWLVDPDRQHLAYFKLVSGEYRLVIEAEGDAKLDHPDWNGLVIDLAALWAQSPLS